MSNTKYLEIDSTYRDRTKWPNPAEFEIPISQSGVKGRYDSLDPVSYAAPIKSWTSNLFDRLNPGAITLTLTVEVATVADAIGYSSSKKRLIVTAPVGTLQQVENYYVGTMAINTTTGDKQRIVAYEYIGEDSTSLLDRAQIVLASNGNFNPADVITVNDPTTLSNTSYPLIYVPYNDDQENSFTDYIIYNENLNEYRNIKDYNCVTHVLQADAVADPVVGWLASHQYNIRQQPPCFTGVLAGPSTAFTLQFPATASAEDGYYNRFFVRLTSGPARDLTGMIVEYDGTTKVAYLSRPLQGALPLAGDSFEVLPWSRDNATPFVYSGSMVSQQEEVCYEVELMNLLLPNVVLDCGMGSRVAYYPYLYVEFRNVTGSASGNRNIIYSNNPNASRMLFRAATDDNSNPFCTHYLKIDGDGMVQNIKFKPNDTLKFSITLPSGEPYRTVIEERYSPSLPNPRGQISALFGMKRL